MKNSIDRYRTVNGKRFIQWMAFSSEARIAAYRSDGVQCRKFVGELFISEEDQGKANETDLRCGEYY